MASKGERAVASYYRRKGLTAAARQPGTWLVVVLALAAVTLVGLALRHGQHQPSALAAAPSVTAVPSPTPSVIREVVFFGDSYTGGSQMGGTDEAGWPRIIARKHGWHPDFSAEGGTGYVAPGPKHNPFPTRVADVIAFHPDLIILAGGLNDSTLDPAKVGAAALGVMTKLHKALPDTRIVVVGPFYPSNPTPELLATRDSIHNAAAQAGLTDWIDPSGWFSGPRGNTGPASTRLIGEDGTHPTDAGHAYIAARMAAALTAVLSHG